MHRDLCVHKSPHVLHFLFNHVLTEAYVFTESQVILHTPFLHMFTETCVFTVSWFSILCFIICSQSKCSQRFKCLQSLTLLCTLFHYVFTDSCVHRESHGSPYSVPSCVHRVCSQRLSVHRVSCGSPYSVVWCVHRDFCVHSHMVLHILFHHVFMVVCGCILCFFVCHREFCSCSYASASTWNGPVMCCHTLTISSTAVRKGMQVLKWGMWNHPGLDLT